MTFIPIERNVHTECLYQIIGTVDKNNYICKATHYSLKHGYTENLYR